MRLDLKDLPAQTKFAYLAMTRSAIFFKEDGYPKDLFVKFAEQIWDSMELSDFQTLKDTIDDVMKHDIDPYVKEYIKKTKQD